MRVALDTTILADAEGIEEEDDRARAARSLIQGLPRDAVVIPVQALGELFNVLVRKGGESRSDARDALLGWRDAFPVVEASPGTMQAAADLATDHQLGIWDAVIISAASRAGCRLLLSEDLHDGFTWGGVTVINPFASSRHPLLDALMEQSAG